MAADSLLDPTGPVTGLARGLADPVSYSRWLLPLAVALAVLVVLFYAAATWQTRKVRARRDRPAPRVSNARAEHLRRLDRLEDDVHAGRVTPREAHQAVSRIVRSFLTSAGPVDVRSMTLADLRDGEVSAGPNGKDLVGLLERIYPAAFAPEEEGRPGEQLDGALRDARALVDAWTP